jgi:hypothetical protein
VIRTLRGTEAAVVTVLDWPNLSLNQRPVPQQQKLYCLKDASATATKLGLPADQGPYYKMVGHAGSSPVVGEKIDADPAVKLALILAAAERGARPAETAADVCDLALTGAAAVRAEAANLLTERPTLRAQLSQVQWSQLVAKATGETDDIAYKIALCELCAEQRIDGLLDSLVLGLGPVKDPEYARCVGRIGNLLVGEASTPVLRARLEQAKDKDARAMLLLAIGASNTEAALQLLLDLRGNVTTDPAIEAALREHGSPRAKEAVLHGGKK